MFDSIHGSRLRKPMGRISALSLVAVFLSLTLLIVPVTAAPLDGCDLFDGPPNFSWGGPSPALGGDAYLHDPVYFQAGETLYYYISGSSNVQVIIHFPYDYYVTGFNTTIQGSFDFTFDGQVSIDIGAFYPYTTLYVSCSPIPPNVEEIASNNVVMPPDHRINWQYGDLNAVVYEHEDGDGVVVYCYVDGSSWLGMQLNQATVDAAPVGQAQNVPVQVYDDKGCHVAFYILDSGEYQINIWTWDGKLYEIIADNIQFRDATMNEIQ